MGVCVASNPTYPILSGASPNATRGKPLGFMDAFKAFKPNPHPLEHPDFPPSHHSFPACFSALSPSTSTHHPSFPAPPSPKTAALKPPSFRKFTTSSLKLPGCSHTAGMPRLLASRRTASVAAGGVTMDREVWVGAGRRSMEGSAGKGVETEGSVMVDEVGLMGVVGRLWSWYHLKTVVCKWVVRMGECERGRE